MKFKTKKTARYLAIRKRFLAMTANEQIRSQNLFVSIVILLNRLKMKRVSIETRRRGLLVVKKTMLLFVLLNLEPEIPVLSRPSLNRTIESFSNSECWNYFETRKEDLPRILIALKLPVICQLSNGSKMSGEEIMLRGLYELVSGTDQYEICSMFGREQPQQSLAFKYFINHIYSFFYDLVTDNLEWWYNNGYLHASMEAIKSKFDGNELFTTFGFIDCNCLETSTPGGGPAETGIDAARWDPGIQKAFYNGWKSNHGLKHQTVDCAYGMTVDMFGPTSLRRNDLHLLRQSEINSRLRNLQQGQAIQLTIYGDSIYPRLSHLHTSWRHEPTESQKAENKAYTKVRIAIEWNYMITASLYSYLTNEKKLKILQSQNVAKIYTVATILRNCHVALYGSETSHYFGIEIPNNFLELYMRVI